MDIHKPKPWHGWREFLKEYGIIVLGVLTALALEQSVEALRQGEQIEQLRSALRGELADSRARWEDMSSGQACTEARLDAIERWLRAAPPTARVVDGYQPMLWNMHSSAWDIAKASSAAQHIPLEERLLYASLYSAVDNWREYLNEERANAIELNALLTTADQPEHRREVAMRVDIARQFLTRRLRNYPYFFTRMDRLHIRSDPSQLTIVHDEKALCAPLQTG
jgi:hypothetical protein